MRYGGLHSEPRTLTPSPSTVSWEDQPDGTISAVLILGLHVWEDEVVRDEILYVARWADNNLAMGSGAQVSE